MSVSPAVKDKRRTNGSLIKCENKDLLREKGLMAYEDGFADAREYGQDGYFMPVEWNSARYADVRLRYLSGFRAGLRVRDARKGW